MVKKPRTIGIDDLLKQVQLEERIYRHRCVEAWAMTVPWTGFPMQPVAEARGTSGVGEVCGFETDAGQSHARPGRTVLSLALR